MCPRKETTDRDTAMQEALKGDDAHQLGAENFFRREDDNREKNPEIRAISASLGDLRLKE